MSSEVTCPSARRVKNRRSERAKWCTHKPWKVLVETHAHIPEAVCVHCLKHHGDLKKNGKKPVYLTINHLSRSLYATEELYTTWNPQFMEICCTTCNWMYEKGKEACPVCHNQYIHVMEPDHQCQSCYDKAHPEEAQMRKDDIEVRKIVRRKLRRKLAKDAKIKWINHQK